MKYQRCCRVAATKQLGLRQPCLGKAEIRGVVEDGMCRGGFPRSASRNFNPVQGAAEPGRAGAGWGGTSQICSHPEVLGITP